MSIDAVPRSARRVWVVAAIVPCIVWAIWDEFRAFLGRARRAVRGEIEEAREFWK
jgi:hypothetical protein